MRRRFYGNGPSSTGLGIFWLMLVLFPTLGFGFGFLEWLIEHIYFVIVLLIGCFFLKVWITYDEMKEEQKED